VATITDSLETLFTPPDLGGMITGLAAAAGGLTEMATAEGAAAASTGVLAASLAELTTEAGLFAAAAVVVGAGLNQFIDDERELFNAAVTLRNRGMEPMFQTLSDYATALRQTTAVDDEAVVGLGALISQFGVASNQIVPAVRAIVDANQAGKGSFDQLGEAFGKALLPGGRGAFALRRLGIEFKATGDRIKDTNTLIQDFKNLAEGAAEARLGTVGGRVDDLKEAIADLNQAIGSLFGPAAQLFLRYITYEVGVLKTEIESLRKLFSFEFPGLFPSGTPAAGVGKPGSASIRADESLDYQRQTAKNTKGLLDAIVGQVIGGPGTIAREAANTLAIRRSLGG
jgi:hypothetical protein